MDAGVPGADPETQKYIFCMYCTLEGAVVPLINIHKRINWDKSDNSLAAGIKPIYIFLNLHIYIMAFILGITNICVFFLY